MSERLCSKCGSEPALTGQRWGRTCFTTYKRTRDAAKMLRARAMREMELSKRAAMGSKEAALEELAESQAPAPAPVVEKAASAEKVPRVTRDNTGNGAGNGRKAVVTPNAIAPEWIYEAPARFVPFRDTPGHGPEWAEPLLSDYSVHGGLPLAAARAHVTMRTVENEAKRDVVFAEELHRALEYHRALLEWESLNLGRRKHSPLPFFDRLKAELPARHVDKALVATVTVDATSSLDGRDALSLLQGMLGEASGATRELLSGQDATVVLQTLPEAHTTR